MDTTKWKNILGVLQKLPGSKAQNFSIFSGFCFKIMRYYALVYLCIIIMWFWRHPKVFAISWRKIRYNWWLLTRQNHQLFVVTRKKFFIHNPRYFQSQKYFQPQNKKSENKHHTFCTNRNSEKLSATISNSEKLLATILQTEI